MFGGDARMASKTNKALKKTLHENKDRIMVFISDLWLDQDKVSFIKFILMWIIIY